MARRKHLSRLIVFVLIAAIFGIVQLDVETRVNSRLALVLPEGLGGYADAQRAGIDYGRDPASARNAAASLLRHRPIEARHLSLFSVIAAEDGDMERASKALNYAATRGWRDPFLQIAVLGSAVASGQSEVAAARLEALARTEREPAMIHRAIDIMVEEAAGRMSLASRLENSRYLTDQLIEYAEARPGQEHIPLQLIALSGDGEGLTCERRARLARTMLKRGRGEVRTLLSDSCPYMSEPGMQFMPYGEGSGPLDWVFPSAGGISTREGLIEGTLTFNNRNLIEKVIAFRYLLLEPGTHWLSLVEHDSTGRPLTGGRRGKVELRITCPQSPERDNALLLRHEGYGEASFAVPVGCPVQRIRLFASRGRGENVSLTLN